MPIEIDLIAIVVMESFGAISFLLSFIFIKHSKKLSGKIEALQETLAKATTTGESVKEETCYSYKWVISHVMTHKKAIAPRAYFPLLILALTGVIVLTLLVVFSSAGYSLIIALIGSVVFFETDAFEAYSYSKAVHKVALNQLNKEDQSYMAIAKEALKMGGIRFLLAGATFALAGPFIPLIFDGLCYVLALYTRIIFQATETAQNVSTVLAVLIAIILPGILLYLPELTGRVILAKIKAAIRIIQKHKRE